MCATATVVVFASEFTESSLCHLELVCKAAFICAHKSFLHDFDLFEMEIEIEIEMWN